MHIKQTNLKINIRSKIAVKNYAINITIKLKKTALFYVQIII